MSYVMRLLQAQSAVSVVELSEAFGLSEVTVRKLLDTMEREGMVRRTWGGAVSALGSAGETAYEDKVVRHLKEKQAIAALAYDLIKDGDAVYLDSGTTTLQLAHRLAHGKKRNVLVCTNALNIAMAFGGVQDMRVFLVGGMFHPSILSCSGSMAQDMLRRMFFDKGFLTGSHFSVEHGVTTPNIEEAEIKRTVLSSSKEVFMLLDYSKYGNDSLAQIAPAGKMGVLVTDWHAPEELIGRFVREQVRVLQAREMDG